MNSRLFHLPGRGRRPASSRVTARGPLLSTPFFAFGRKPFREARIVGLVLTQHRRGRPLADILDDPLLRRFGSDRYRALTNPHLIEALRRDVLDELRDQP